MSQVKFVEDSLLKNWSDVVSLTDHITSNILKTAFHTFHLQCRILSIFGDTVYPCYCKFRLVTPAWWGLRGRKFLILATLDRWKRHFREQNYIENYFYLLKSTKSTKTTSQKCWRNIIWAGFFGRQQRSNGIKTRLGSPVTWSILEYLDPFNCHFHHQNREVYQTQPV